MSYTDSLDNTNRNLVTGVLDQQNETLTLNFTPGASGQAEITVHATDSTGRKVSDTFSVKVDVPPLAKNDSVTTSEDTGLEIDVTVNDVDSDGFINEGTVEIVSGSGPAHGEVTIDNGVVTYTPSANYSGSDSFRYTVKDNEGYVSNEATVAVTVEEVADYQNTDLNADVDVSGKVSPIDVLIDINYINTFGNQLPADPDPTEPPEVRYDVNGDNRVDGQDLLIIIGVLNDLDSGFGEGESLGAIPESDNAVAELATFGEEASLLAVPDYSLASRLSDASPVSHGVVPPGTAQVGNSVDVPNAAQERKALEAEDESAFEAIGADSGRLIDLALDDVLSDIVQDIDDANGEQLLEDLVLSGLTSKAGK